MIKVYKRPEEVWRLYKSEPKRFEDSIAVFIEETDSGKKLGFTQKGKTAALVMLDKDDRELRSECVVGEGDFLETVKDFAEIITPKPAPQLPEPKDEPSPAGIPSGYELGDIILEEESRRIELSEAMEQFLQTALVDELDGRTFGDMFGAKALDEILDYILSYLASVQGFYIYFPTVEYDEDKPVAYYYEYPYNDDMEVTEIRL